MRFERTADGLAWIHLGAEGRRDVPVLGTAAIAEFEQLLDELARQPPKAVIVRSDHPDVFLAGADLEELSSLRDRGGELSELAELSERWLDRGQRALARLRALEFPSVAWIDGAALGGGLEVALACSVRIVTTRPSARLGMPEVQLGLVPALGGSFDVPCRMGLRRGLECLLSGRRLSGRAAFRAGLVDEIVPPEAAPAAVRAAAESAVDARSRAARRVPRSRFERWPGIRTLILARARGVLRKRPGGSLEAPRRLVECVAEGLVGGRPAAEAAERRAFAKLAASPESAALVGLFLASRGSGHDDPAIDSAQPVGILGAGFMGAGIARVVVRRGRAVRLHDRRPEALGRAIFGLGSQPAVRRVTQALDLRGFERCELVIEAVTEDLEVKRALLREIENRVADFAILASNTSTLPIGQLARGLRLPNRLLGLHFFSPVERMPLVEVVRHATTGEPFVHRAREFVRSIGKTPVVVRDGPGFFTTRVLAPYLAQGVRLVAEGASIREVDRAARRFGFPVGPLELLDEVGIDVALAAARTLSEAFADRMPLPAEFRDLVENGRLGRKVGQGFYDYKGSSKRPDRRVEDLLAGDEAPRAPSPEAMTERLVWSLVAEALRAIDEGVVGKPEDGDLAAVLGLGFPPWLGGPWRWARAQPAEQVADQLRRLAGHHGAVFGDVPLRLTAARSGRAASEI